MPALSLQLSQKLSLNSRLMTGLHVLSLSQTQLHDVVAEALSNNPLLETAASNQSSPTAKNLATDKPQTSEHPNTEPQSTAATDVSDVSYDQASSVDTQFDGSDKHSDNDLLDKLDVHQPSLREHLLWQCEISQCSPSQQHLLEILIDALDDAGYLHTNLSELAQSHEVSLDALKKALTKLHSFEPSGVGAQNLQECLRIQLEQEHSSHPDQAIAIAMLTHVNWLADYPSTIPLFAEQLDLADTEIQAGYQLIQQLSPQPGRIMGSERQDHVRPDVIIETAHDGQLNIRLTNQPPSLQLNRQMLMLANQDASAESKAWAQSLKSQAADLINAIAYRQSTMLRIGEYLIAHQSDYFKAGLAALKPCLISDAAEALELSISTLSRAANNKYIDSPQGTESLRLLFSTALPNQPDLTNRYAKARLKQLIQAESLYKPLSDTALCEAMKQQGIHLSRRAICKYRLALNIPNSQARKLKTGSH